jgi:hypothetical protein
MRAWFASLVLGLVACAGSHPPPESTVRAPDPTNESVETPQPLANPTPRANDAVGRYHLEGEVDAVNLELYADGTFRMRVNGCDYGSLECGRWESNGGVVKLVPKDGAENVHWFAQSSFRAEVKELVVSRTDNGLHVEGATAHAGAFVQDWHTGGTCADCGGSLGPTGRSACETPIEPCSN